MNPDEVYKNKMGERLTRTLADALSQGTTSEDDAAKIADYILENIDKATNNAQLLDLLTDLAHKWPIFDKILTIELGETMDKKEEMVIEQAGSLIKQNKIEEAVKVVKTANDQKIGENV